MARSELCCPGSAQAEVAPDSSTPTIEVLAADATQTTVLGNTFVAPMGWRVQRRRDVLLVEAPEGGTWMAFVDVTADDADAAVATAWKLVVPSFARKLRVSSDASNRDSWSGHRTYDYETSPNEHRGVSADARRANGIWTVVSAGPRARRREKRASQVSLMFGKLLPKGYARESFAGQEGAPLDAARVARADASSSSAR